MEFYSIVRKEKIKSCISLQLMELERFFFNEMKKNNTNTDLIHMMNIKKK